MIVVDTFPFEETDERLAAFEEAHGPLLLTAGGHGFTPYSTEGAFVFEPPRVFPIRGASLEDYRKVNKDVLPDHVIVLVQSGATALGYVIDENLALHKVIKKYVVRGKGRAQPLHLKTQGKSRYGSRLRLQNFKLQLEETNERLVSWWRDPGPPELVFKGCPVRLWPELFAATPAPPFRKEEALSIPFDIHVPGFDELRRIASALRYGRVLKACQ